MNTLRRIVQLTLAAMTFLLVAGISHYIIGELTDGRVSKWRKAPFTGEIGDEMLGLELALLPTVLGVLASWAVVRLFRLRAIDNEVNDSFKPVLQVLTGYGRFALIVVAGVYLVIGSTLEATIHFVGAVLAFALFYIVEGGKERAALEKTRREREPDDEDDSEPAS